MKITLLKSLPLNSIADQMSGLLYSFPAFSYHKIQPDYQYTMRNWDKLQFITWVFLGSRIYSPTLLQGNL